MESAQQLQRIAVTVECAIRAAGHLVAYAGNASRKVRAIEHFDVVSSESGLRLKRFERFHALRELLRREAYMDASRLYQRNVESRLAQQLAGQAWPLARRALRPRAVRRE